MLRIDVSDANSSQPVPARRAGKRSKWRLAGAILILLVGLLGLGRLFLPTVVRDYVNRSLNRSLLYGGQISGVSLHLWRGAYSIQDVRINKKISNVPVPFFDAERVDFALQWNGLLRGRIVSRILMERPELNFVDAPGDDDQSGTGGPWLKILQDLSPFKINSAVVQNGSVHFRVYQEDLPVDVYLSEVQGTIENLSNIRGETSPRPARIQASGRAMDQARFEFKMTLDPFSYRPTFQLAARLLGLDVTLINDLALAYGNLDFQDGWLDFVLEMEANNGQLSGYAKPLFRDLRVFDITGKSASDPIQYFWEALVGVTTTLLENPPRDQFGTLIPFSGDLSGSTTADLPATVGNILRNAFVRAYLPQFEPGMDANGFLEFQSPEFIETFALEN